jgi:hypothetical protein
MSTLIHSHHPTARKEHECMACLWLQDIDSLDGFTFAEKRAIAKAKANNWRIQPGERYLNQKVASDGDIGNFKAIIEIDRICRKYDFYEYD